MAKYETVQGVKDTGEKITVTSPQTGGDSPKTGYELMQEGKEPQSPTPSGTISGSKYGDPNAPSDSGMQTIAQMAALHQAASKARREGGFYGHVLPQQFKKTSIISTHGRVR